MLSYWSTTTKFKSLRTSWSIVYHELAWGIWSWLNLELIIANWISTLKSIRIIWPHTSIICLEHIGPLGSIFHLKLTRTCWSIIYHKLAWCSWTIFESIHIRSSWPIVNFKLWTLHWSAVTNLFYSSLRVTTKIHKLWLLKIVLGILWSHALSHIIIITSTTTHIWTSLVQIIWIRELFLYRLRIILMSKPSTIMCLWRLLWYTHWLLLNALMELTGIYCIHLYWIQRHGCIWRF